MRKTQTKSFVGALLAMTFLFGRSESWADDNQADRAGSRAEERFELATGCSRLSSNDGSNFFGVQAGWRFRPRLVMQLGIYQSLSDAETGRAVDQEGSFIQRAGQVVRLELGGAFRLASLKAISLEAQTGFSYWRTELTGVIEGNPHGDLFNFAPVNVSSVGWYGGVAFSVRPIRVASLSIGTRYFLVPKRDYGARFDILGEIETRNYQLGWSGFSYDLSLQIAFR